MKFMDQSPINVNSNPSTVNRKKSPAVSGQPEESSQQCNDVKLRKSAYL
jgi:hypothetical protein